MKTIDTKCSVCGRPIQIRPQLWILSLPAAERDAMIEKITAEATHYACQVS